MDSGVMKQVEGVRSCAKKASVYDYLALARLSHSTKHVFIIPGIILAFLLRNPHAVSLIANTIFGFVSAICVASANYVINEYLDRNFDRFHPTKCQRPSVQCEVTAWVVILEWLFLLGVGLVAALAGSETMLFIGCLFAMQGIFYNVPPIRTKDKPFLDVITESVNNPIRLLLGWVMVDPTTLPPSSVILSYWFGGAFLMAAKRYSEYREISSSQGLEVLVRYRASFSGYSEVTLNASCFVYGLLSIFFLAIFLTKYRVEYLLLVPAVISLFGYYLMMSTRLNSTAQNPERLFQDRNLVVIVTVLLFVFLLTTWIDIPALSALSGQKYISLR